MRKNKQKAPNNTISMTFWFCSHLCLLIPTQNNKSTLSFSFCISAQKNLESMTENQFERRPALVLWATFLLSFLHCALKEMLNATWETKTGVNKKHRVWFASWWLNQPLWKIWVKMGSSSPRFGVNIKNIWNHHLVVLGSLRGRKFAIPKRKPPSEFEPSNENLFF